MALSAADQAVRDRFAALNLPSAYWDLVPLYNAKEGDPAGDWYDYWVPMVHKQYLLDQEQQALDAAFTVFTGEPPPANPTAMDKYYSVDAGGAGNAYTITRTPIQTAALESGQKFLVTWPHANTGAVTVQVDGLAPVALEYNGAALAGGEIESVPAWIVYDGTSFQMTTYPSVKEITADMTINVRSVPGAGEYATLTAAIAYLDTKLFHNATITFDIGTVTTSEPADVVIDHPHSKNIRIVGAGAANSIINKLIHIKTANGLQEMSDVKIGDGVSALTMDKLSSAGIISSVEFDGFVDIYNAHIAEATSITFNLNARFRKGASVGYGVFWSFPGGGSLTMMELSRAYVNTLTMSGTWGATTAILADGGSELNIAVLSINHTNPSTTGVKVDDGGVVKVISTPITNNAITPYNIPTNTWQNDGSAIFVG